MKSKLRRQEGQTGDAHYLLVLYLNRMSLISILSRKLNIIFILVGFQQQKRSNLSAQKVATHRLTCEQA
jgi:hypothetical protein